MKQSRNQPLSATNSLHHRRPGFHPWVGKILRRRERLPTLGFWPGGFHGLDSPWFHQESGTTGRLSLSHHTFLGRYYFGLVENISKEITLFPGKPGNFIIELLHKRHNIYLFTRNI